MGIVLIIFLFLDISKLHLLWIYFIVSLIFDFTVGKRAGKRYLEEIEKRSWKNINKQINGKLETVTGKEEFIGGETRAEGFRAYKKIIEESQIFPDSGLSKTKTGRDEYGGIFKRFGRASERGRNSVRDTIPSKIKL